MAGFKGQFLSTIGLEHESIAMDTETVGNLLSSKLPKLVGDAWRNVCVTNDASIQFKAEPVKIGSKYYKINTHTSAYRNLPGAGHSGKILMGFELYTLPLEIPDFSRLIPPLFSVLIEAGDFTSHRASTHFHTGFANNLLALQNFVRIALELEPTFYRLGGMGGTHRGYTNQYNYCRPLMNAAAVPVGPRKSRSIGEIPPTKVPRTMEELLGITEARMQDKLQVSTMSHTRWVKVANPIAALDAETIQEFWASFGIDYVGTIQWKYHPVRYSGWNLFAIPKHGTIEARHCNQSLDAFLVIAVGKLCRAIAEMATKLNRREGRQFDAKNPFVEIDSASAIADIEKVISICQVKDVEDLPTPRELSIIYETIEKSHVEPLPAFPVKAHIRDYHVDAYLAALGKLEDVENPAEPNHVDIHTIVDKHLNQSLFDEKE